MAKKLYGDNDILQFRTKYNKPVRIALMSGHVTIIGKEWKPIHKRFWSEAYRHGCISEDMMFGSNMVVEEAKVSAQENKRSIIKAAMKKILRDADPKKLKKDGKPNAIAVGKLTGFMVTTQDILSIYDEIATELNGDVQEEIVENTEEVNIEFKEADEFSNESYEEL